MMNLALEAFDLGNIFSYSNTYIIQQRRVIG